MLDIFKESIRILESGRRAALATIISTTGSTPGKDGARMLIRDDGTTVGTVGGGCSESDIWRSAMEVIATGRPRREKHRLTAATVAETGLLCGGEFEVYIEPLGSPWVIILGAGHVARALESVLSTLQWRISVIDDREEFASDQHFSESTEVTCVPFENCLDHMEITANCAIVVVTRGHQHDELAISRSLLTPAGYVGLIGSKGKAGAIMKNLREQGCDPEELYRVRSPVGLPIGSQSPEEIAISISAELIAHHRGLLDPPQPPSGRAKKSASQPTE
ncbi:MAG TPA: xanthine dehydrogenase [Planctomycetes bacterium]|nr:xanthine dehydrogenase [Planctomycetota bacterium]